MEALLENRGHTFSIYWEKLYKNEISDKPHSV